MSGIRAAASRVVPPRTDRDLRLIATNPRIARERAQFKPPVRLYPYRAHLIIYLVDSAGVLMVRVLHNRQEWERHL